MASCYNVTMPLVNYKTRRIKIIPDGCWEWQTGLNKMTGYANWCGELAHRKMYRIFKGELTSGLTIDHLCSNRKCVNPKHLEEVTHQENLLRSEKNLAFINKYKTHCKSGHIFNKGNTYTRKDRPGRRECKACRKQASLREYKNRG